MVLGVPASHRIPHDSRDHGVVKVSKETRLCGHLGAEHFSGSCRTAIAWTFKVARLDTISELDSD